MSLCKLSFVLVLEKVLSLFRKKISFFNQRCQIYASASKISARTHKLTKISLFMAVHKSSSSSHIIHMCVFIYILLGEINFLCVWVCFSRVASWNANWCSSHTAKEEEKKVPRGWWTACGYFFFHFEGRNIHLWVSSWNEWAFKLPFLKRDIFRLIFHSKR